jgi:microcystin-dependent protein
MPQDPFLGEIFQAGFNFPPVGYAYCNGTLLSIAQNTALFSLLGTTFGGDGVTNFALPNLQSRVPLHFGQGPGLTPYNLGEVGGVEGVTLTINQMPSHNHPANASTTRGNAATPAGNMVWARSSGADGIYQNGGPNTPLSPQAIGFAGGNQPHENRMPYLALNFYIALQGIYPARD